MALTPSNYFEKGAKAPDFSLFDSVSEKLISLDDVKGDKGTVILFICNHCPYVIHINDELVKLADEYLKKGIGFVAISSNDIEKYPQDAPNKMKTHAQNNKYPFPYLYDETQEVAKKYDAACTPDIYLFDNNLKNHYHGQLDNSRPGNDILVTGEDLRNAMNLLLEDKPYSGKEKPSMGCNIKWKN